MNYKIFVSYFSAILFALILLVFPYVFFTEEIQDQKDTIRVLTYSSFIQEWGAGPKIAALFEEETGCKVQWINAGNAGLIIERLKFKRETDKPDVVFGLDQFSIFEANKLFKWKELSYLTDKVQNSILPSGARFNNFLAYDWGPLTFVYKKNQVTPPKNLTELIKPEFANSIILQDPRMSSPGLQFFLWILNDMGEKKGFEYLKQLKQSIKIMSPSWSSSYSVFKMEESAMVFSYFTSPFYHLVEENDANFKAIELENPHPIQVEYMGIPEFCNQCEVAEKFANFIVKPEIQKILMEKNYMFPVAGKALEGSSIVLPKNVKYYKPIENISLIQRKRELINKWKKVFY